MRDFMRNFSAYLSKVPNWGFVLPILFLMFFHYFVVYKETNGETMPEFNMTPTENEIKVFEIIDSLPQDSKVLILVNYGPESKYELEMAMSALIGVLAEKNIGIAFATMIPNGVESAFTAVEKTTENGSFGKERFVYGIYSTNKIIGFLNEVTSENDEIEVGYFIASKEWNKGYATEALKVAIEELFAMGYKRVVAGHFEDNPASGRVMQKAGMKLIEKEEIINYRNAEHRCLYYQIER